LPLLFCAQTTRPPNWSLHLFGVLATAVVLISVLGSRRYLRRVFARTTADVYAITRSALRPARKIIVFVVGTTIVLIGVAMIVLPGPAVVVIPLGLAILGTEFFWARRLLRWTRAEIMRRAGALRGKPSDSPPPPERD